MYSSFASYYEKERTTLRYYEMSKLNKIVYHDDETK